MTPQQLQEKLAELLALPHETEWAEFKHNNHDAQMIGEYLSAISNAAALENQPFGYIVWGVEDGTHNVVGTTFKPRQEKGRGNEDLEPWLNKLLHPRINFRIFEFDSADGHPMVMFEIQAANTAPVAFAGRRFVRVGSHKKPLGEHPEKERKLWEIVSGPRVDWSAEICEGATLDDLDPNAIEFAREEYLTKLQNDARKKHLIEEVPTWNDETFLNKAKVCISGAITRTAIILLGKEEATHHIAPGVAQISWILRDADGTEQDYQHFHSPLILAVSDLFDRVRNLTIRHMPDGTLFPVEVSQYDPWVLRETLHNSIAHQDYRKGGRINVVESPDSILFTNQGLFLPGSVEEVIDRDAPSELHQNEFLANAMVNLNMIDTIGSGIKRAFGIQRKRHFPMPTYDLSENERVKVRVYGQILDPNYTKMLMAIGELSLKDVIALDKVQKGQQISDEDWKSLKTRRLIEGRRPNKLHVSAEVAQATDTMVDYLKKRGIDKDYCQTMIHELLGKRGKATRADFENLLMDKLSDVLDDEQKSRFIGNLLQEMRKAGAIQPIEGKRGPGAEWELTKPDEKASD